MTNNFHEEDRCWFDPICDECGSNRAVALHHLRGRRCPGANSILNACPLCFVCHKKADATNTDNWKGRDFQLKHITRNIGRLLNGGYKMKKRDYDFLTPIQKDLSTFTSNHHIV